MKIKLKRIKENEFELLDFMYPQFIQNTVSAPLIVAASNQKIFSKEVAAASIQERPLIKK